MLEEFKLWDVPIHVFKTINGISEFPSIFYNQLKLCYVLDGILEVEIEGRKRIVNQGDICLIFPNIPHTFLPSSATALIAIIDNNFIQSYQEILLHQKPKNAVLTKDGLNREIKYLFQQIYDVYIHDSAFRNTILYSLINALFGTLIISCKTVPRNSKNELIEKIIVYLSEHFTSKITLDDIAKEFGYNKYYISHIISESLFCNFSALINIYRIGLAQNLLIYTNKSISNIASECGFQNQTSFSRVFSKRVGLSPGKFRIKRERY